MKDIISEGGSVAVFPEANSSFDSQPCFHLHNPAKLAKLLDVELVIYNLRGAYFSNPRWTIFRKKGPTIGQIRRIITKEEVRRLSLDELEAMIEESISIDEYANNPHLYRGKNLAKGLERLVFFCPKCHLHHTLESRDNRLFCNNCGFEATYDERGYLTIDNIPFKLHQIARPMIDEYEKYVVQNINEKFTEDVNIKVCWGNRKRGYYPACTFSLTRDGITIIGKKIDFSIPFEN